MSGSKSFKSYRNQRSVLVPFEAETSSSLVDENTLKVCPVADWILFSIGARHCTFTEYTYRFTESYVDISLFFLRLFKSFIVSLTQHHTTFAAMSGLEYSEIQWNSKNLSLFILGLFSGFLVYIYLISVYISLIFSIS